MVIQSVSIYDCKVYIRLALLPAAAECIDWAIIACIERLHSDRTAIPVAACAKTVGGGGFVMNPTFCQYAKVGLCPARV